MIPVSSAQKKNRLLRPSAGGGEKKRICRKRGASISTNATPEEEKKERSAESPIDKKDRPSSHSALSPLSVVSLKKRRSSSAYGITGNPPKEKEEAGRLSSFIRSHLKRPYP